MSGPSGGLYRFKGAPARSVPFPKEANMTAVELLTFLPNHITSLDVVYRFASNKTTCNAMVPILYAHRDITTPSRKHTFEYCHRTMRNIMREGGHTGWRLEEHLNRFEEELRDWDAAGLSVGAFRTRVELLGDGKAQEEIPFASLCGGVTNMSQGSDALDLTRMIQHCMEHPDEQWMYPTDYKELLEKVGGAQQPIAANTDQEIFKRWHDKPSVYKCTPSKSATQTDKTAITDGVVQQTPEKERTPDVEAGRRKRRQSNRREMPSRKKRAPSEDEWRPRARNKVQEPAPEETTSRYEGDETFPEYADDVRPPLRWEKAPPTAGVMSTQFLQFAFGTHRLREKGERNDPYDAYAFGDGPRTTAPFRPLHLIQGVKSADLSGWAENVRWAREQHMTFGEQGWTECAEHMQRIAQIRKERLWASGELMLSIQDEITREVENEEAIEATEWNGLKAFQWREPDMGLWVWGDLWEERFNAATGALGYVRRQKPLHHPSHE